jgi:hypothetical protein
MGLHSFLNSSEQQAYNTLSLLEFAYCFKLFPKVKLGDVLELRNSGLEDEYFDYGCKAHFDFIVVQDNRVRFAIEVDGPSHYDGDKTHDRDTMKNYICEHFDFELLRIDQGYLNEVNGYLVLPLLLQDYLEHFNPTNDDGFRKYKQPPASSLDIEKTSAARLRHLEKEALTVHESLGKYKTEISTLKAKEDEFYYSANYVEVGNDEFCIGHGSARPSKLFGSNAERLANCLSLIDLGKRVELFEESRIDAKTLSDIKTLHSTYSAPEKPPEVRKFVVRSYSTVIWDAAFP